MPGKEEKKGRGREEKKRRKGGEKMGIQSQEKKRSPGASFSSAQSSFFYSIRNTLFRVNDIIYRGGRARRW